jgi:hypothetical protein
MSKRAEPPIPSIDECVAAGTHMVRCTADGACKVCFSMDPAGAELFIVRLPSTAPSGAGAPLTPPSAAGAPRAKRGRRILR